MERKSKARRPAAQRKTTTRKATTRKPTTQKTGAKTSAPRKMKAYATFDLYEADQPPRNRTLIRALRAFVARAAPKLQESVKWGNGCWLQGKDPVAYVYSAPDYVQFGFFHGSALTDPRRLLEGTGQYVRHIKVRAEKDIDEAAFRALLRQAMR